MRVFLPLPLTFLIAIAPAAASSPTDISFSARRSTLLGDEYYIYTVRCADGNQALISGWEEKSKWCVGLDNGKECFPTQLKAAGAACR